MIPRLDRWRAVRVSDWQTRCTRPLVGCQIEGDVYGRTEPVQGRPARDGERLLTSVVVASDGRVVTTESGSRYELLVPSAEYVRWLTERKIVLDAAQPIRGAW